MSYKKLIFALLLFSQVAMAQGKAGSLFLAINPGARANAMGEAQIGIATSAGGKKRKQLMNGSGGVGSGTLDKDFLEDGAVDYGIILMNLLF